MLSDLAGADASFRRDKQQHDADLERVDAFIKYAKLFGSAIAAVVLWCGSIQRNSILHSEEIGKLIVRADAARELHYADQREIDHINNSIVANRAERVGDIAAIRLDVLELKKDTPKVTEMWLMKQMGRSNKEEFQIRNGYPAPDAKAP